MHPRVWHWKQTAESGGWGWVHGGTPFHRSPICSRYDLSLSLSLSPCFPSSSSFPFQTIELPFGKGRRRPRSSRSLLLFVFPRSNLSIVLQNRRLKDKRRTIKAENEKKEGSTDDDEHGRIQKYGAIFVTLFTQGKIPAAAVVVVVVVDKSLLFFLQAV